MHTIRRLAVMAALLGLVMPAFAESSPGSVAVAYFAAIKSDGLVAAADYIHPDELQRFRGMFSPLLANVNSPVAQSFAQAVFGSGATAQSVAALDPLSFTGGFMGFVEGQLKGVDMTFGDMQILGSVPEGETVHLVTRSSPGAAGVQITRLEVMSLKPYQDTWRLLLSGEIEGLAQALNSAGAAGR